MVSWLLCELFKLEKIDAVIHVKENNDDQNNILFKYGISDTITEIKAGSKSRYYPIEMSEVLSLLKKNNRRYAIVGLPCFIKSIRKLTLIDPVIKSRIIYTVGLVCGHLKSKSFAEYFGWQMGINPSDLTNIDFRVKLKNQPANYYGVKAESVDKESVVIARELKGSNWGHNMFRYSACDYCDDVFAETADVVIGDAWLPDYEKDPDGTCIIGTRKSELSTILMNATKMNRLQLVEANLDDIIKSQEGGLRDRREGLSYRLWLKKKDNLWAPKKRVKPSLNLISTKRQKLYDIRLNMRIKSHLIWQKAVGKNSLKYFNSEISALVNGYNKVYFSRTKRILFFLFHTIPKKVSYILKRANKFFYQP